MATVVAYHWSHYSYVPSFMARARQMALTIVARECLGVEPERWLDHCSDYLYVDCGEQELLTLLARLQSAGCTDLHVHSADPTTWSMVKSGLYGQFHMCEFEFPEKQRTKEDV